MFKDNQLALDETPGFQGEPECQAHLHDYWHPGRECMKRFQHIYTRDRLKLMLLTGAHLCAYCLDEYSSPLKVKSHMRKCPNRLEQGIYNYEPSMYEVYCPMFGEVLIMPGQKTNQPMDYHRHYIYNSLNKPNSIKKKLVNSFGYSRVSDLIESME